MMRIRRSFGRIKKIVDIPNLIEIQKNSYEKFLQTDVPPEERVNVGLQGAFRSVFPIVDFGEKCSLEFVSYRIEKARYDVKECIQKGMTYNAPLKIVVRLVVFDTGRGAEKRIIRDIKEQEIYFGEIPLMTEKGTFLINGTERVIVSQLHRSPGIFFDHDKGKTHGKLIYSARVIPIRGSWLDLEFDPKDLVFARIDRRRKMPVTILLKAMGYTDEELLSHFNRIETLLIDKGVFYLKVDEFIVGERVPADVVHPGTDETFIKKGRKVTRAILKRVEEAGITRIEIGQDYLVGRVVAATVKDESTGEEIVRCNEELDEEKIDRIFKGKVKTIKLVQLGDEGADAYIRNTLLMDKIEDEEEAIVDIYRRLRPSNPPTVDTARRFFNTLFFSSNSYDLSDVGRAKMNYKLKLNVPTDLTVLRKEDILEAVTYLINLRNGRPEYSIDDIDHLGNRRIRSVGELIENQYRIGLVRMERAIKEKMSLLDVETMMPNDLANSKPVTAVVNEFFGSSQLSQFMDQTNPLSEVTHKRRLSALGPGGLTRERAGFEVRDVHNTHYGRICPVETPEGPNIGLIVSLSTYASVNEFGFIETPSFVVRDGRVFVDEIRYLTAMEEETEIIAQADSILDKDGRFVEKLVTAKKGGDYVTVDPGEITLMDVSPNQLVSVAAGLIPFLEHDDANRALMGSNMQRQSVPLLQPQAPLVGTGMEQVVARDSGAVIVARRSGIIEDVDASRIVVKADTEGEDEFDTGVDIYNLIKYQRSNQDTCFNHKPIVKMGDHVAKGDIIADGPATQWGELALGRNVMVAFMSWGGYNYEDSILVSERIVKDDIYTSVHIEEFETVARDTKLGKEEITRDIPNVGDEVLRNLDESGIARIGVSVKAGDILVGKVTPKGETQLSPEEKLLRAIFGEKAGDVRDTSLHVPPGVEGTVVDAKIFSRKGTEKDGRTQLIEDEEINRINKDRDDEITIITESVKRKVAGLLAGHASLSKLTDFSKKKILLKKNEEITEEKLQNIPFSLWKDITIEDAAVEEKARKIFVNLENKIEGIEAFFEEKKETVKAGDELPPGVIKLVKVYVAIKRKLSVGDKMAGRHGNKGVLSRILPEEDMPFFADGTPVDIVLNPLGVPSRMNVGQVLETHLGWASKELGAKVHDLLKHYRDRQSTLSILKDIYGDDERAASLEGASEEEFRLFRERIKAGIPMASPVFDGAGEEEIKKMLSLAALPVSGQTQLYDGRTGRPFDQEVTVGIIYMLKLHHLVDDKIHARSIGPYSLVTQQPLGGKAQFGGQRLGEMEVWAIEAYGAAYSLQEFLTVKSDDVAGRTRMYEAIVKGDHTLEPGLPESFNVLIKELQGLSIDVELLENDS
ncbi:MAG: DNA-directed RNA polymerase subunit beta [Syntrophales bacterium]|jgi:DNA-directed RNA polymerase subunit beta|nr:DNA-directed RNA polymerase subunit beta [Syntrophales bacterium]MCK9528830.1 DNA-directed RNA polymerase subunit beta [Syntrophales bacterium]MDX9921970.1 DNA-directed RNA polymerase subunit beta [Syntrophales bacterium]